MTAVTARMPLWERLRQADAFVLVARLTLVTLVVNARGSALELAIAAITMAVLFLEERRLRSPWPWLAAAAALAVVQGRSWWQPDDHVVASTYWILALGLSRFGQRPEAVRRLSARLVVATIFTLAFGWKALSSQYTSNDFFRYTLAWDDRFEHVAELGGTDMTDLHAAQDLLMQSTHASSPRAVALPEGRGNATVAWTFTIWGLLIEGAVALVHLLRLPQRLEVVRPITVMVFCATTYVVLPVAGFGFLLLTLAAAETRSGSVRAAAVVGCAALATWSLAHTTLIL